MNPSMPAWGSAPDYGAELKGEVANLAPLAPAWHGPQNGVDIQYAGDTQPSKSQGVLPAFWGKVESIGKEAGHLLGEGASLVGHTLENVVIGPVHFGEMVVDAPIDHFKANSLQQQQDAMNSRLDDILQSYKSGNLTKSEYKKALDDWGKDNGDLSKQLSDFNSSLSKQTTQTIKSAIDLAGDAVTIFTLGLASPEVAASERAATTALESALGLTKGAEAIGKLATDKAAWKAVNPTAQLALKLATQQTLEAAGKQATAAQVGRAVAANVLLKYPLTYNAIAGTGQQLYKELDNDKYGDAVKTAAFNAALLLSGGVIGWGLKSAGKLAKATSVASGLRPGGILDELSSRVGDGDRLALGRLASQKVINGGGDEVKAMIVGLESNLKRTNGNVPGAINNIVDHLEQYIGWGSLKDMSHEQLWDNMVNYWKHAEGLEKLKKAGMIDGIAADDTRAIVPGRFTTQDKNLIAEAVTKGDLSMADTKAVTTTKEVPDAEVKSYMNTFGVDEATARNDLTKQVETVSAPNTPRTKDDRLAAWEAFKQANPNIAAANNPNVDKQITHLIETIDNPEELHKAINGIKTQVGLKGIPEEYAAQMAKDGYVAIVPESHNLPVVPFAKTSGQLATNGAEGDFFVRTGTPIPVLQSVGTFLTWAGLSPEMAQTRVQDVFRGNFQQALGDDLSFLKLHGDTDEQAAHDTLQKLYNYMKAPTVGRTVINGKPLRLPMTDLRQLTNKDVATALGISRSEARSVQQAILQAYIDVPRSISGLGTKILDVNFKYNPFAAKYSKLQSGFRFGWNPIFRQGKLPMKAEFLAQMETGGKFPTVAGTNTFMKFFFPGQYKEIDGIVGSRTFKSLMPGGLGGEAADLMGEGGGASTLIGEGGEAARDYPKNALRPVAGLVRSMADRAGMDAETFMQQFPGEVQDAATAILHYDKNNSFLNSPMAKTLNVAFFPFRFNVKVTTFMAKALAKQQPVVQYAVVKGLMDAHKFLNSPQGMAWYSQNSDAIGLFKYFSPLETISTISNALGLKHDSTAEYGELGGLPFGWIPLMLDSVGLTHFGQAYVNPKTGVISKDYVPTSMYGAANSAIQDLLSSLFTWPGATAGFPSKSGQVRNVVNGLLPGSKNDFTAIEPTNVTPEEQQFANIVQQMNGTTPSRPAGAPVQNTPSVNVPTQSSPLTTPNPKGSSRRKKKSDYRPSLLPGQSELGQL